MTSGENESRKKKKKKKKKKQYWKRYVDIVLFDWRWIIFKIFHLNQQWEYLYANSLDGHKIILTTGFIFLLLSLQQLAGAPGETSARWLNPDISIYTRHVELFGKSIFSLWEIYKCLNLHISFRKLYPL